MTDSIAQAAPVEAAGSRPFWQIWKEIFFHPNVETQEKLLAEPGASGGRALLWMAVSMLAVATVWVIFIGGLALLINLAAGTLERDNFLGVGGLISLLLAGEVVLVAGIYLAWLLAAAGVPHLIAKALGGTGAFSRLLFLTGAILTPISIVRMVPFLNLAALPLGAYGIYLQVVAVRAVHKLSWARSAAAVLAPVLVVLGVGFILFAAYFAFILSMIMAASAGQGADLFQNVVPPVPYY